MRKTVKGYVSMATATACLLLALSNVNAYAGGGFLGGGGRTDPTPPDQSTSAATQSTSVDPDPCRGGGYLGGGGRCEASTTDGGGGLGSGNLLAIIDGALLGLFG